MKKTFLIYLLSILSFPIFSQIGGNATYQFLNLPNAARVAALGGNVISLPDSDFNVAYQNPSLLNSTMNERFVLNYVGYIADIKFGYAGYCRDYKKYGTFAIGIQYINYGKFTEADEKGVKTGTFHASESAFNISWSKRIDSMLSVGISIKPVISALEQYNSFGLATDLGATYFIPKKLTTLAIVIKNFGTQLKPYREGNYEPLPFDIQLGITKRLAHAPFRLNFTFQHLTKWDLVYRKEQLISQFSGETNYKQQNKYIDFGDKLFRHIVLGVEVLFSKNFIVNLGYNYQRHKELRLESKSGFTGFSWGFNMKVSKYQISFGRARYHLADASNHFSFSMNMSDFYRKK